MQLIFVGARPGARDSFVLVTRISHHLRVAQQLLVQPDGEQFRAALSPSASPSAVVLDMRPRDLLVSDDVLHMLHGPQVALVLVVLATPQIGREVSLLPHDAVPARSSLFGLDVHGLVDSGLQLLAEYKSPGSSVTWAVLVDELYGVEHAPTEAEQVVDSFFSSLQRSADSDLDAVLSHVGDDTSIPFLDAELEYEGDDGLPSSGTQPVFERPPGTGKFQYVADEGTQPRITPSGTPPPQTQFDRPPNTGKFGPVPGESTLVLPNPVAAGTRPTTAASGPADAPRIVLPVATQEAAARAPDDELFADRVPAEISTGFSQLDDPLGTWRTSEALPRDAAVYFWFEIGAPVAGRIDLYPVRLPEHLPARAELTVMLFSQPGGFAVPARPGVVRLAGEHGEVVQQPQLIALARPAGRRLLFELRAPSVPGAYSFRCNVYHMNLLVQSFSIHAAVGIGQLPDTDLAVYSKQDYVLSSSCSPAHLRQLGDYRLSIMANSNDGTHGFRFFGGERAQGDALFDVAEVQALLDHARSVYREVSWGARSAFDEATSKYRYAEEADFSQFESDLTKLARAGFQMWTSIGSTIARGSDVGQLKRAELQRRMRAPGGQVQLAMKRSGRHVLPISLLYDHPLDAHATTLKLCPAFLQALNRDPSSTKCFTEGCPHYGDKLVICPSGFWGFRHAVGVPVSMETGDDTPTALEYDGAVRLLAIPWGGDDFVLRDGHLHELEQHYGPGYAQVWSRADALEALKDAQAHLVYFYCHGGLDEFDNPHIRVGGRDDAPIGSDTFAGHDISWASRPPLVFINGCHTAALEPDRAIQLVDELVREIGALGVIGTEITIFEPLAVDFATRFFRHFTQGMTVGEAVQRARLDLLGEKLNPLGLLYIPYVLPSTRLAAPGVMT